MQDIQRDVLHRVIDQLPESALVELAKFVEFLQFKIQHDEESGSLEKKDKNGEIKLLPKIEEEPPFNPVHFPEGVLQGVDFSPEYIKEARKELWGSFGEGFE